MFVSEVGFAVLYATRLGFTYRGRWLPFTVDGSQEQKLQVSRCVWEGREVKKKKSKAGDAARLHASPDLLKGHYPNLAEFLTTGVYEDGERRESPTITLWASGGQWKAILKDRAEGLVMWLSEEKLLALLMMAEQMCLEEDGPWRVDDQGPYHGKRKKGLG